MLRAGCLRFTALHGFLMSAVLLFGGCAFTPLNPGDFPTRAESSGFTETSLYDDMIPYLRNLDAKSARMRLSFMGTTAEGRPIPLAVLGDPPPKNAANVDRQKTTIIYIQANIHAGEIDGKEAALMLIRDLATGPLGELLENTVVLVAPDYNADGNERIDPENRSWQPGPEGGVGIRTNAQSLDLNRDMMKLESPEAQNLVQNILVAWDPHLLVDCHTTNGSYHEEPITYAPPHNPLGDPELMRFNSKAMLPWILQETREREGYLSVPYGNFRNRMDPSQGWYTFDHMPRYVTNYIGLRNRLGILIEMYIYAPYEVRVKACRAFLHSILAFAREHGPEMRAATDQADARTLAAASPGGEPLRFHTAFERKELDEPITIRGYRMELGEGEGGRRRARPVLDEPVEYTVPYFGEFEPQGEGIPLPEAYIFPRGLFDVRDRLVRHGIIVEELTEPVTAIVDAFNIEKIDFQERLYQGHRIQKLEGKWDLLEIEFKSGAFLVPARQPLAMLAAYLLEPESDDGLACWNFLDRYLGRGPWDSRPGTYPVMRLKSRKPASDGD